MDNMVELVPKSELTEMQKKLILIKKELDTYIEFQKYQAKLIRGKYEALIEEGFSEMQALELSKIL